MHYRSGATRMRRVGGEPLRGETTTGDGRPCRRAARLWDTKEEQVGYSTDFSGELRFTQEPNAEQLAALEGMLGEDCRDHPEWKRPELTYIDLELTDDASGLKWDGSEKTYDLVEKVNLILHVMREKWPDFGLTGSLLAQGEDITDRWVLTIGDDGAAKRVPVEFTGRMVTCPHCSEEFALEG